MTNRCVFLDRDGIVNKPLIKNNLSYPPHSLDQFEFSTNIKNIVNKIKEKGFLVIIITNQPDIAKGLVTKEAVEKIHHHIKEILAVDDIYYCPHLDEDNCNCRKPKPGMILEAAQKYNIDLKQSYFVGDRWRDVKAGKNAGCTTIFVDYKYNEKMEVSPDVTITDLGEMLNYIK